MVFAHTLIFTHTDKYTQDTQGPIDSYARGNIY